jgi:hypothetical protein
LTAQSISARKGLSRLYYGWRMIELVSGLRILGGGLHQYGFTVFFLLVTQGRSGTMNAQR